ncbi:MAG: DNA mismatch repair endonuclease MutL [Erysipelotrichaceae bacterium]|nr:DNA mismatch repair endonuclease MutL [Erysipelotrichaceae bacterium]
MGKIAQLNQHLTNMIAAGEVIERPAGVVKELIENAIDAQASSIEVNIKEGGITYIQVIDNGTGMDSSDAVMAFERHATSKLKNDNDLWSIRTMGFRGEALPSIASISKVALSTNDGQEATSVRLNFGQMMDVKPYFCPEGTQVTVEDLFQKTPARLKHLKTRQYEAAVISGIIEKFALSQPQIAFTYRSDDRVVFQSNGNGNLAEVIGIIYGMDVARNLVMLNSSDYDYVISGAYALPSITRATKNYIAVFINSRMVRSYRLQKVIMEIFKSYLPDDRYPIVVMDVRMDAQLVDVNVHPSKWEIRLSKEQQLEDLVRRTLLQSLSQNMQAPKVKTDLPITATKIEFTNFTFDEPITEQPVPPSFKTAESVSLETAEPNRETVKVINSKNNQFPIMSVIGQFHGNYILAESIDGLYIIDQHAAQERYNYERFQQLMMNEKTEYQTLLIPLVIEIGSYLQSEFDHISEMLQKMHVTVELFGTDSLLCRSVPVWMSDIDVLVFIHDMVDFYQAEQDTSLLAVRKAALASLACHASVKFNQHLNLDEMKEVILHLQKCENPFNCPHGRPTFIHLTESQLKKEFLR